VQTYIDAQSLDLAMSAGRRWNEAELKQIVQSLLKILDYLHSQIPPVIHRDIKPSNILISNRSSHHAGDIYLVDFGSVQSLGHRDSGTMTIVGTYGYMPPEQFGGKAFPASDLYSLGATIIYLGMRIK
jgi:serine/threonine protein kinase